MKLDVAVVGSERGFAALAGEWDTLFKASPRATPFQSWSWLSTWWQEYGHPRVVRVITVRRDGLLVGALPLMLDRGLGRARLEFIGTGLSDHLDGLAEEGLEDEVVEAWARGLAGIGGWTVADLQEVPPHAVVRGLQARWSPAVQVAQSVCPELEVETWEQLLTSMSRSSRKVMRRTLRAADAAGVQRRSLDSSEIGPAIDQLLDGHRSQWAGRDEAITEEHGGPRFQRFLREAVAGMVEGGQAEVIEFHDDEAVLVRNLFLIGQQYVGDYLYSATEDALERFTVAGLFMKAAVDIARSRDLRAVNLLRGDEPWKRRWHAEATQSHRLILGRWRPSWAATAGYHIARAKAAEYARDETSPGWLRTAIERVRVRS